MDPARDIRGPARLRRLLRDLVELHEELGRNYQRVWKRLPPYSEMLVDRWQRAKALGFGEGTSIYDSSLVIGNVKVGKNCWIGPATILDGSGNLSVGDFTTISAGVHVYTHDNVRSTLSSHRQPLERSATEIGCNVYIAPNSVITRGVTIGNYAVLGSFSFVNRDVPSHSIAIGQPARVVGKVEVDENGEITFNYSNP
jgi:acetyltransferase-like isoleucine patch superfamily enzyme